MKKRFSLGHFKVLRMFIRTLTVNLTVAILLLSATGAAWANYAPPSDSRPPQGNTGSSGSR